MRTRGAGFYSAVIYTAVSLSVAAIFFVLATTIGYDWVARIGGAAWVFMLCMIVLMPIVTPVVKRRFEKD